MTGRRARERGSMLLQAMILIMLLAMLGVISIMLTMGRAMVVEKAVTSISGRFVAQAANSRLNFCLRDATPGICTVAWLRANCGFPFVHPDPPRPSRNIDINTASWTDSSCRVKVRIN